MNNPTEYSNLVKFITEPLQKNLDRKLESYYYYDVCKEDQLMTNKEGIDIISHQLELKFEGNSPVFISWDTIKGWFQFSLCVSATPFCNGVEAFLKKDNDWADLVGKRFIDFEVYGYKENTITSTETATGRTTNETFYNEPHLLILHFENERELGLANFHLETDFIPRFPTGDDLWIIFGRQIVDEFIGVLSLEKLDV